MKKVLWVILVLLVVAGGFFGWLYIRYLNNPDPYKNFILPHVSLSVIEITSLTAEKSDMNVSVLIKNQLPFTFTVDSFEYELHINDAEIMKSRYQKRISLGANDSSWIKLPVTVYYRDVDSLINANEKRKIDSAEYRMHATFFTDILFHKKFDLTVRRYLPLIHVPDLKVTHLDIDSLNLKRAAVTLQAEIRNDNVFDIRVKDYEYEFQVEDHEWIKGVIPGLTVLKSRQSTTIKIPVTLSFKEVGKTLFQLLKKGSNVNYQLQLKLIIASDLDMLRDSKAIIRSSGSVKSLLKAVKGKD